MPADASEAGGEPGPITPGGDHGSPLSPGRPDCDRLASFDQHVPAAGARLVVPTHDFKQPISFSRRVGVRGLQLLLRSPPNEGGRSAERRSGAAAPVGRAILRHKTRVNALMTRHARRLRGALRPMTRRTRACSAPIESGGFSWGRGWERLSALIRFWEAGRCQRPILGRCGSE